MTVDVVDVVDVVDNNKIIVLDDITCDRLEVLGIICMILWIFIWLYMATMINPFKLEILGFLGIGLMFPAFALFHFLYFAFGKTETKVFKISKIERYLDPDGGISDYIYDDVNKYDICCEFLPLIKERDIIEAEIRKKKILKIGYVIRENPNN